MRTRLFHLCPALAAWMLSASAAIAESKGIDPALLSKAEAGSAEAQYRLGNMYNFGDGVRRDYAQALLWYLKGAAQGDAGSQFQLGGLYHFGHGVPQDDAQGFAWIEKAAEQNDVDAEFFISTCYTQGWGVPKDEAKGAEWLRKAAEQGDARSQYFLGQAYYAGTGVSQDYSESMFWLDLAASEETDRRDRKRDIKARDRVTANLTLADLSHAQERARQWLQDHPAHAQ